MKSFDYRVYNNNAYVGSYTDVTSDPNFPQDINTAGSQVTIHRGVAADNFGENTIVGLNYNVKIYVVDYETGILETQLHEPILTQDGQFINVTTGRPNGQLIFSGFISSYVPTYDSANEGLDITLLSYGIELDNNVIETGASITASQTTNNADYKIGSGNFYNLYSSGTALDIAGVGTIPWGLFSGNPGGTTLANVLAAEDSSFMSAAITAGAATHYLGMNTNGFTIPSDATIIGVVATVVSAHVSQSGTGSTTTNMNLIDNTGAVVGTAHAVTNSTTSEVSYSVGSSSDLWGVALTPAMVNSANFGVAYYVANTGTLAQTEFVDKMLITVYYLNPNQAVAQSVTLAASTVVGKLSVQAKLLDASYSGVSLVLNVYQGNPSGVAYTSGTSLLTQSLALSGTAYANYTFVFATPLTFAANTEYYFTLTTSPQITGLSVTYAYAALGGSSGGGYASGDLFTQLYGGTLTVTAADLWFQLYATSGNTVSPFNSQDPSTILKSILDDYIGKGGHISYTAASIDMTGTIVSYTFNTNTTLDGIRKCLDLAPAGWYWYIDQANNILHFHNKAAVAARTLILGRELTSLQIQNFTDNIINLIYFTGGPTSGVNLFKKYSNSGSITTYGVRLQRYTDNRVTLTATADKIANTILTAKSSNTIRTTAKIVDNPLVNGYNIEDLLLGSMIGFAGFNATINALLLQVVRIEYLADSATLTLSSLPENSDRYLQSIANGLADVNTLANPTAPA